MMPVIDNEEAYCYEMLAQLRRSYESDAKPYIDRLVKLKSMQTKLKSMQTTAPIVLTLDQAQEFIDFSMSARAGA